MDEIVTVYEFETFDKVARSWKRSSRLGTLDAITRTGGVAIRSTALNVDATRLDPDGFVSSAESAARAPRRPTAE